MNWQSSHNRICYLSTSIIAVSSTSIGICPGTIDHYIKCISNKFLVMRWWGWNELISIPHLFGITIPKMRIKNGVAKGTFVFNAWDMKMKITYVKTYGYKFFKCKIYKSWSYYNICLEAPFSYPFHVQFILTHSFYN